MAFAPPRNADADGRGSSAVNGLGSHRRRAGERPTDWLALGLQAHQQEMHSECVAHITKHLVGRPECADVRAFVARGHSAQATDNHVRAVYDFSMAIRLEPSKPAHRTARAVSLGALRQLRSTPGALHDHDAAVELCAEGSVSAHERAVIYLARGLAREEADLLDAAVEDLSQALELLGGACRAAERGGALVRRGICRRRLGKPRAAIDDLSAAVEAEPSVGYYRKELALDLLDAGEPARASAQLVEAMQLPWAEGTELSDLLLVHARALRALGSPWEAQRELSRAIEVAPGSAAAHLAVAEGMHADARAAAAGGGGAAAGSSAAAGISAAPGDSAESDAEAGKQEEASGGTSGLPCNPGERPLRVDRDASGKYRLSVLPPTGAGGGAGGGAAAADSKPPPGLGEVIAAYARAAEVARPERESAEARLAELRRAAGRAAPTRSAGPISLHDVHSASYDLASAANETEAAEAADTMAALEAAAAHGAGMAEVERDDSAAAVALFERAAHLAPQRADSRMELGLALAAQERYDAALEQLEVGASLRPNWAAPRRLLGEIHRDAGRYAEALREFSAAVAAEDAEPDDLIRRGGALLDLGRPADAVADFVAARLGGELPDGLPTLRLLLAHATALRAASRRAEALRELGAALRHAAAHSLLSPPPPSATALIAAVHSARGRCLLERRAYAAASRAFDQSLAVCPDDADALAMRAAARLRRGRPKAALADVRRALALLGPAGPAGTAEMDEPAATRRAELQQMLGLALARVGELWGAVAALSACMHLRPATPHALQQRGLLLLLCERPEAAEADLTAALALRPGWSAALQARAYARKARRAFDAAAEDFEAAAAADPALRVDYSRVFHRTLRVDSVFGEEQEAGAGLLEGWEPMPCLLDMEGAGEEATGSGEEGVHEQDEAAEGEDEDEENEVDEDGDEDGEVAAAASPGQEGDRQELAPPGELGLAPTFPSAAVPLWGGWRDVDRGADSSEEEEESDWSYSDLRDRVRQEARAGVAFTSGSGLA